MNEFQHRVPKKVRILAVIEAPRHFVQVGREMLCFYGDALPEVPNGVYTRSDGEETLLMSFSHCSRF